ncbi:outer membrane protein assembly factor [Paucihalobacter ruber]|uniref:Outer membrane protein assembly factor n=1 Tax=Paucihalobacter ruber TaxID=2567861 RepID=A0A506PPA3_9FLAO|nr:BamA/TamA family outer membrane protein [Paucihalobacter ruber]TPV35716.1 outer membrane protein assembly factor [Paucihalobacter ruber]
MNRAFNKFNSCIILLLVAWLFASCDATKRVKADEFLLTKTGINIDGKKTNSETLNSFITQKENARFLGVPIKLHFYNLAHPNLDSVLNERIYNNPKKVARKTKLLSRKQLDKQVASRLAFNKWIKNTGEAPVIVNEARAERTTNTLRRYYFSKGWFNAKSTYDLVKNDDQTAQISYNVERGQPWLLDTIKLKIGTPAIDSLYRDNIQNAAIQLGQQYDENNFTAERKRISEMVRNAGYYNFGQEYVSFEIDTLEQKGRVLTELQIQNRSIEGIHGTERRQFKKYTIKEVNIFTDFGFETKDSQITDSVSYNGYNLYSISKLAYRPKAITDAIIIAKGNLFSDTDRANTNRYISQLRTFRYPSIEYIENETDSTLITNVYLSPRKKYDLGFSFDVLQSNIQTIGFAFSTGLVIRNVFRGAETLDISGIGSIGSSREAGISNSQFFNINEFGANVKLTIPRIFFPIKTEKIIPKFMSPTTRINLSVTGQTNIGLDKQTLSGILGYNWFPKQGITNTLDLFNIQYVRNLNPTNYFDVYSNAFNNLNTIAQDINYVNPGDELSKPDGANLFIDDVLNNNTSLNPSDPEYIEVSNIEQRRVRLTENNLIVGTSFLYVKDKRTNLFDNNFSIFKMRLESAGFMLSNLSTILNTKTSADGREELFGVNYSQYIKTEFDYIKYFGLSSKHTLAFRSYFGIAVPYGNAENIPFARSFFAGGPNDNRAWTAYNLGPGSTASTNEFNEANLKIHLSTEYRFPLTGSFLGAFFIDAGNIWNVLDDIDDPKATFTGFNSLKDIAVGTGFGLRYDFNFFILRGDIGFKTYDPSQPDNNRWFTNYNFANAVYNIGINYPF